VGKDFKIGLISGVVLGFVALIWVATRPSQSPKARMLGPTTASSQEALPLGFLTPSPEKTEPTNPAPRPSQTTNTLPPSLLTEEPEIARAPSPAPTRPTRRPPQERRPDEPNTSREQRREKITTTRFHIVQRGETLSSISQLYYGSAHRWQKILEANPEAIKDANKISPGTKLTIPDE